MGSARLLCVHGRAPLNADVGREQKRGAILQALVEYKHGLETLHHYRSRDHAWSCVLLRHADSRVCGSRQSCGW